MNLVYPIFADDSYVILHDLDNLVLLNPYNSMKNPLDSSESSHFESAPPWEILLFSPLLNLFRHGDPKEGPETLWSHQTTNGL